jgi:hypothetical protein
MTDEEYVRAQWEPDAKVPCLPHVVIVLNDPYWLAPHADDDGYEAQCWSAAKAFTEQREEEIRQVGEEVKRLILNFDELHEELTFDIKRKVVNYHLLVIETRILCAVARILAVEQDRLKALKQGMVAK